MELFEKAKQLITSVEARRSFDNSLVYIRTLIRSQDDSDKKLLFLDYIQEVIKRDLHAEFQAAIFYEGYKVRKINAPFPMFFRNVNGESICIVTPKEYKEVDLSNDCIFALPWRDISVISTVNMLSEIDFEYIEGSHGALYYYPIDICYVHNGNHSISAGMYFKKGKIKADFCDITPLFSNVYTDGASWYNIHTNNVIEELCDFRIALLFEVAKLRYNVETQKRSYTY